MMQHLVASVMSGIAAMLVAGLLPASSSVARAATTTCIEQRPVEQAVVKLRRDRDLVHIEHTCAGWQTPVHIEGVQVLATDLVEDAGPMGALLRVEAGPDEAFERRVQVGDRVGERWVVVAASQGVVLFDDGGVLLAAVDRTPVTTWRLTWHSPFSLVGMPSAPVAQPSAAGKAGAPAKPADASKVARPSGKLRKK